MRPKIKWDQWIVCECNRPTTKKFWVNHYNRLVRRLDKKKIQKEIEELKNENRK